ncbi:type VI secretion system Vgr family protein [Sorangium sp. So ce1182]|uniref:type VI secretion system Vgr family protein n=1 Tax=Sorangium sp. So ce1182 TaxID=3133334 RepID=UPI003F62B1D8
MATSAPLDVLRHTEVTVASGDRLDIRHFHILERMSALFELSLTVVCENADIDFDAVVGQPMTFTLRQGTNERAVRTWTGICSHIEQVAAEELGVSTYKLVIVPVLWLLTQRRNHRMFQLQSELDIARVLLAEWNISTSERISGTYKKRKYRVQYGETDFTFLCRMLEDAGISFYFQTDGGETRLVLDDAPQTNASRVPAITFRDNPTDADREHVTKVRVSRRLRPGKYTVRDHDYRRVPEYVLRSSAQTQEQLEAQLERYHYVPGAFLYESDKGQPTPVADDRGRYRTDEREAVALAQRRLEAKRVDARTVAFDTNTIDLAPGTVVSFLDHPKSELSTGSAFLVTGATLSGEHSGEWSCACEAVSAGLAYRPPLVTPKPKTSGVESATVVGPPGEEIHTDEFGRVRVYFHWDRESKMNERSSCWIHVSQPWAGASFGGTNLPRVGQEVIVDFLGGDPDRPIIVGRVYTNVQKTPYKLPDNKTQSGWQSRSSPGGGPDNYNEIMFEDRKGQELVRMQAEKNLDKLVKNDESVRIGHDRTKQVGHDDALTVGNDRTRSVGHDETVSIGNDRTRLVGNNERVTVGNSRTRSVGVNESLFVGANQQETVGHNRSVDVGANHNETIGKSMSLKVGTIMNVLVGVTKAETIGIASAETVGVSKTLEVGATYKIGVKGSMDTTVGGDRSTTIGGNLKEAVTGAKLVAVGEVFEVTCGPSKIHIDKDGNAVIEATKITLKASGPIGVEAGAEMKLTASGEITVNGSTISMNG